MYEKIITSFADIVKNKRNSFIKKRFLFSDLIKTCEGALYKFHNFGRVKMLDRAKRKVYNAGIN